MKRYLLWATAICATIAIQSDLASAQKCSHSEPTDRLIFAVFVDGDHDGYEQYTIPRTINAKNINGQIEMVVKLAGEATVFGKSFSVQHHRCETWKNNELSGVSGYSEGDEVDEGTTTIFSNDRGRFLNYVNKEKRPEIKKENLRNILILTFWNLPPTGEHQAIRLPNPTAQKSVVINKPNNGPVSISGELNIRLWYDRNGLLQRMCEKRSVPFPFHPDIFTELVRVDKVQAERLPSRKNNCEAHFKSPNGN